MKYSYIACIHEISFSNTTTAAAAAGGTTTLRLEY